MNPLPIEIREIQRPNTGEIIIKLCVDQYALREMIDALIEERLNAAVQRLNQVT